MSLSAKKTTIEKVHEYIAKFQNGQQFTAYGVASRIKANTAITTEALERIVRDGKMHIFHTEKVKGKQHYIKKVLDHPLFIIPPVLDITKPGYLGITRVREETIKDLNA